MALPSTKDPKSRRVEASFERAPPQELEETLPFSLLNELIGDLPDGVVYRPPELKSVHRSGNGNVPDTHRSGEAEAVKKPTEDSRNGASAKAEPEVRKPTPKPVPRKQPEHQIPFRSETIAANVQTSSAAPPVPPNFPKFHVPFPSSGASNLAPLKPPTELREKQSPAEDPTRAPLFPKVPNDDQRPRPKRGFQARPAKRAFDPVDKAIRIFETLGKSPVADPRDPAPAVLETEGKAPDGPTIKEPRKPSPEEEAAPPAPAGTTLEASVPPEPANLQAAPPSAAPSHGTGPPPMPAAKALEPPPASFTQGGPAISPAPAFVPAAPDLVDASSLAVPKTAEFVPKPLSVAPPYNVVYRRRRRRPVPVNPWTAQGAIPGTKTSDRQQHIDASLAELAKILQASLDHPPAATAEAMPSRAPGEPSEDSQGAGTSPTETAPKESPQLDPVPKEPVLRKSFSPVPGMKTEPKVKLVPRALSDQRSEGAAPVAAFEITAPTTLVGEDSPISPFTKVVQGASSPHGSMPTPRPNPAGQSPFVPAGGLSTADLRNSSSPAAGTPATPFASPFATALEKRRQISESSKEALGGGHPTTSETTASPLRVTPIRPPENPSLGSPVEAGQLPDPAVSFASVLPSSAGALLAPPPRSRSRDGSIPRNRGPVPRPANSPAPQLIRPISQPDEAPGERTRKKRGRFPAISERRSWRMLSGLFGIVCILLLLIYLYEMYGSLSQSSERWPGSSLLEEGKPLSQAPTGAPPEIDLSEPLESLAQFLAAESNEHRTHFVVEQAPDLATKMDDHYASFPMTAVTSRQIIDGGNFPDTGRDYITALVEWEDGSTAEVHFIRDGEGNFRFSWQAFEQARNQLLRRYAETAWTGWTSFFVEIRPIDPRTLPEGIILENLYYRVTVPEDPDFEAIAYVDENSSMVPAFEEQFSTERSYRVIAEMQRGANLLDDDRPVFRLTRLLKASWDLGGSVSP